MATRPTSSTERLRTPVEGGRLSPPSCRRRASRLAGLLLLLAACAARAQTWTADNGNGTYSNPLFYDEFSDPDLIRVGDDFYLTGTTMHSMPGLPVLHSKDLVNWSFLGYALDRLDLGPEFRLEGGKQAYGQGIWAPSLRYHAGTFYIFADVNGHTTQLFRATDPRGPWTRTPMKRSFHDLSVLFDDDGKVYVVWGYRTIHFGQLDDSLTDLVPGTERVIIDASAGMGEGLHFYKIGGKYYITSAWYAGRMRMPCARADRPEGPYEVNPAISADEDFGVVRGYRLRADSTVPFRLAPPDPRARGQISLHQGGIVDTPTGEWWGFSMMDYNSVGRLTALSPVTWKDGWPWFGLPGNLGRTPRIWTKPHTGTTSAPHAPYVRDDDFSGPALGAVWQWNHVPDDTRWSLAERPGYLRLHSLPAADLWWARNTLTQRAVGPRSVPTAVLETAGMRPGDVAGLALFNRPYAWIGVRRDSAGYWIEQFDQTTGRSVRRPLHATRVWLRASCDFLTETAGFSFSTDGRRFEPLGGELTMVFQLKTFQGVRYALFHYNDAGAPGGYADFDAMTVYEPNPRGLTRPIPLGRTIAIATALAGTPLRVGGAAAFEVVDRGLGRVALRTPRGFVSVDTAGGASRVVLRSGEPTAAETFQWIETPYGDLALLSLATHRYLRLDPATGALSADHPGPEPGRDDGAQFRWGPPGAAAHPATRRDAARGPTPRP
ncbi:MAG: glycoside hydrolase 43 family protein [Gemmatimonadetes bacterium]|nr:glycoside hydrolase 43 family protein [Gemmatimonadota bacterium]